MFMGLMQPRTSDKKQRHRLPKEPVALFVQLSYA
jgi:hypothetical protein